MKTSASGPVLAIIPCSREKIWDAEPQRGAVTAGAAYTSPLHLRCQEYAKRHADGWMVLSAKYGFLAPGDPVPGSYDVTFSRPDDPVVSDRVLANQAQAINAQELLLLLPPEYEARVRHAFFGRNLPVRAPFAPWQDLATLEAQIVRALSE